MKKTILHTGLLHSGKTIRFKTDNPRHKDAIPYKREKHKVDYRDYD